MCVHFVKLIAINVLIQQNVFSAFKDSILQRQMNAWNLIARKALAYNALIHWLHALDVHQAIFYFSQNVTLVQVYCAIQGIKAPAMANAINVLMESVSQM